MEKRLFLEQVKTQTQFSLPTGYWPWEGEFPTPVVGDTISLMTFSPKDGTSLEPRKFKVANRNIWMHCDPRTKELTKIDIHLWLEDLGPSMRDQDGLGALGLEDPAYPFQN